MNNLFLTLLFMLSSCTISFQNISTNGKAEDVVDDQLEATADVKPNLNIPIPAI